MNFDERVQAVAKFGFTDRQARFLVTVMLHAGMCVPRQYARFVGTAYGHNVTKFFDKLVHRRYATASDCLHTARRSTTSSTRPFIGPSGSLRAATAVPSPPGKRSTA